jgi:hypothetical protein
MGTAMRRQTKRRIGRPPRMDSPVRINVLLPRVLREWLRRRAVVEDRAEGNVIASALEQYRKARGQSRGP